MFNNKQEKKVSEEQLTNSNNNINNGTVIVGDIEAMGNLRIDGKIKGNIRTKNKLVLGPSSYIDGDVLAQNADIEGQVTGTVQVTELLILKPSAKIDGDIVTNKMSVEAGAIFNGGCKMGVDTKEIKFTNNVNGQEASSAKPTENAPKAAKTA